MGNSSIKGFAFLVIVAALTLLALQLSNSLTYSPDSRGIGGDWKPYTLDAHSKMDNYFRVNGNEGVYTTDSEQSNQTYTK